jgi:hypothetical protein
MSSSSNNIMGVIALFAVLFFIGLIAMQVMEFMYYSAEPSIWPTATP